MNEEAYFSWFQQALHGSRVGAYTNPQSLGWEGASSWDARGLRFYQRSAQHRRNQFARHVYGTVFRAATVPQQKALEQAWVSRHAGEDIDWIWNARGFKDAVVQLIADGELPEEFEAVATHDWALFEKGLEKQLPPPKYKDIRALAVNPTLDVLELELNPLSVKPMPSNQQNSGGTASVAPSCDRRPVAFGYYIAPETLDRRYLQCSQRVLAALRIAEEALPLAEASSLSGLPQEQVEAMLREFAELGILVHRS